MNCPHCGAPAHYSPAGQEVVGRVALIPMECRTCGYKFRVARTLKAWELEAMA